MQPLVKTVCLADSRSQSYQVECAVLAVPYLIYLSFIFLSFRLRKLDLLGNI